MLRKPVFLLFVLLCLCRPGYGQQAGDYMVAFYNVENLFDTINEPNKADDEFTPQGEKQWETERYRNKINNLARVISSMNNGNGPDILGLCEVENSRVLKDLINTPALKKLHYGIIQVESADERGIDVAMLYKEDVLPWISFATYTVSLPDSVPPTRQVLVAQTELGEAPLSLIICHFPSRSEGKKASEYKRLAAAGVTRRIVDSLLVADNTDNIIVMGDFNDEPDDESMKEVLGGADPEIKQIPVVLYNLAYPLKNKGLGTYKYRDSWNMLDQVLVNTGLYVGNNGLQYTKGTAAIYSPEWLTQTEPKTKGEPLPTFDGKQYKAGYSDHFPVYIYLNRK